MLKRAVEITSFVVGVLGFALAFYWHAESVQERIPAYYVSPERTTIVDTSVPTPSPLQILYKGKAVNQNVTGVLVYLWNEGKLPIRAEDVLEPIKVQLSPGCEILDVRVMNVSRLVTKLGIGDVNESAKNSLPVIFSILEQSDGLALQIIYAGPSKADVSVVGTVVGAREPRILSVASDRWEALTRKDRARSNRRLAYASLLFVLFEFVFVAVIVWRARRSRTGSRDTALPRTPLLLVALSISILLFVGFSLLRQAREADSPGVPVSIWTRG